MPSVANLSSDSPGRPGREMTGRTVLGWIIGFFAVIFLANAVFLWLAISSFSGIEATSAYKAGQTFASDKAMAEAQAERGWKVSTEIVRAGTGADVRLSARDIAGAPVGGVRFLAVFKRPGRRRPRCHRGPSGTRDRRLPRPRRQHRRGPVERGHQRAGGLALERGERAGVSLAQSRCHPRLNRPVWTP